MWKILNATLLVISVLVFAVTAPAEEDPWESWTVDSLERLSPYRAPLDLLSDRAHETKEQHDARYKELARDLVAVVKKEKPLPGMSRANSLRLILSIAFFESGFHQAVDEEMSTWKGPDLVADRTKCFRAGMEIMRRSMSACASLPARSRLSAYASGKCSEEETEGVKRWVFAWGRVLGRKL